MFHFVQSIQSTIQSSNAFAQYCAIVSMHAPTRAVQFGRTLFGRSTFGRDSFVVPSLVDTRVLADTYLVDILVNELADILFSSCDHFQMYYE